ncbi:MAG: biotin--[acetyl-CoA-carboxylase] ligase [Flavobacterium sp.]|nr:biotin--[acetyl-CoA-carboxylase] ligase [Flavobacterium sp.]
MIQIKLNAIDSTNTFLKANKTISELPNYTVVTAEFQTNGRGQHGAKWESDPGKNLIASILVHDFYPNNFPNFEIIIAVSVAIQKVLNKHNVPELAIKWPNDIMSGNYKIGGILIENLHKSNSAVHTIIGFGLNVNQLHFDGFPSAGSLAMVCNREFDRQLLLEQLVDSIQFTLSNWETLRVDAIHAYQKSLFCKGKIATFKTSRGSFEGSITGVNEQGKLIVQQNNQVELAFDLKEIQLIY